MAAGDPIDIHDHHAVLARRTAGTAFACVRDDSGDLIEFCEQEDLWEN